MASFITLYSGSSGNSTLIRDQGVNILVDMGKSCKLTLEALYSLGLSARDIGAVLVTHEHSDHVSGLMTFLKHYKVPVYGAEKTLQYLKLNSLVPDSASLNPVEPGQRTEIGGMAFVAFRTSHDSEDCMGYRFEFSNMRKAAIATDLGYVSDEVMDAIAGCELVGLESNYDDSMLLCGRYPYYLKSRIRSHCGHLSNEECGQAAAMLASVGTERLVLMHLSKENNLPEIARMTCESYIENIGCSDRCAVVVAPRDVAGEMFELV